MLTSSKESLASSSLLSSSEYLWCVANCNVHFAAAKTFETTGFFVPLSDFSLKLPRMNLSAFFPDKNYEESLDGSQVSGNDLAIDDCNSERG